VSDGGAIRPGLASDASARILTIAEQAGPDLAQVALNARQLRTLSAADE